MRRTLSVSLAVLTLAACGGGGSTSVTAVPAATSSTATTTTIVTTTTEPELLWVPLETVAMPAPILGEEYGGEVVSTWCEIEYEGAEAGTITIDPIKAAIFGFIGLEHDPADCDLAFDDLVEKDRHSANYAGIGECFTGYSIRGEIVAGSQTGEWRWPVDVEQKPPLMINRCSESQEPPGGPLPLGPRVSIFREPLQELLGPLGSVAWAFGGGIHSVPLDGGQAAPELFTILAAALQDDSVDIRCDAALIVDNLIYQLPRFDAGAVTLVPYLIDTLVYRSQVGHADDLCDVVLDTTLSYLTYHPDEELRGAEAWAEWWRAEGGS